MSTLHVTDLSVAFDGVILAVNVILPLTFTVVGPLILTPVTSTLVGVDGVVPDDDFSLTVIFFVAVLPLAVVTVTVTVPAFLAVNLPDLLIVAIDSSLTLHVTVLSVAFDGLNTAFNVIELLHQLL